MSIEENKPKRRADKSFHALVEVDL